MQKPKVSIVIPTFNRAEYLQKCINAALAQTYPCEIIVCDHGSTDNTPYAVRQFGDKVKYIRRDVDLGVHFCWLDGVINASGEYVHMNFDDDWIEPEFIEKCISLMKDDVGFVFTKVKIYEEKTSEYSQTLFQFLNKTGIYDFKYVLDFELFHLISPGCTIISKKDLIDNLFVGKVPFSRVDYKGVGPDLLFTNMLSITYKNFGFINDELAIFRSHASSITVDAQKDNEKQEIISKAYDEARLYYLLNLFVKKFKVMSLLSYCLKSKRKLSRKKY